MRFDFDLVFSVPGAPDAETLMAALAEAGCDDALPGFGVAGLVALAFSREGAAPDPVIAEALAQARAALPDGARLREVRPDLVSLAEVAARLSVSRQALQKRAMPPPSLGGLYRATELAPVLASQPGKIRTALDGARGWFEAAEAAQRINARLALGDL